tara:strand:- start:148 stop:303 length:156 start_codon:yes stop_codon:yes gene_type:complete
MVISEAEVVNSVNIVKATNRNRTISFLRSNIFYLNEGLDNNANLEGGKSIE